MTISDHRHPEGVVVDLLLIQRIHLSSTMILGELLEVEEEGATTTTTGTIAIVVASFVTEALLLRTGVIATAIVIDVTADEAATAKVDVAAVAVVAAPLLPPVRPASILFPFAISTKKKIGSRIAVANARLDRPSNQNSTRPRRPNSSKKRLPWGLS